MDLAVRLTVHLLAWVQCLPPSFSVWGAASFWLGIWLGGSGLIPLSLRWLLPLHPLQLHLLRLDHLQICNALHYTCMSSRSPPPEDDVIELAAAFRGLQITIRGPANQASEALSQITGALAGRPASSGSLESAPSSDTAGPVVSTPSGDWRTRAEVEAGFLPCPEHLLAASSRLAGSPESARARISRAWLAGCWARAVLDNLVPTPNRTTKLELRSRYFVVLRCQSLSSPVVFQSTSSYWRALQEGRPADADVFGEGSLSHAFPSETEARTYLRAAGFEGEPTFQP